MKKWRKTISLALISVALFAFAPISVQAQNCDPCDWNLCDLGEVKVGVDFLYWKPCIDDLDYAAVVENGSIIEIDYKNIDPDWEPGVRAWVYFPNLFCDFGLRASYTFIESNASDSVEDEDNITTPLAHLGIDETQLTSATSVLWDEAEGHFQLTYHEWDVLLSSDISCHECHHFKPFFGLAGIVLDQQLKVELEEDGDTDEIKWDSDYWGVGLRAGTKYYYNISDCLGFYASAHGTILAGEADSTNDQDFADNVKIKDNKTCHVIPGYHIGTGFVYETCMCDWEIFFKLGYEFLVWHNVPNHRVFVSGVEGTASNPGWFSHSSSPSTRTLAFHGLSAGLGVSF